MTQPTRPARLAALVENTSVQKRQFALLALAALTVAGLLLSGCNTTAGLGQDVKASGAAVTRGAEDVKSKL